MSLSISRANDLLEELFAPWVRDLRLRVDDVSEGAVRLHMPYDERLARIGGTVCGQALMSLADTTMVFVVASAIGEFKPMTTVNQSTSFMRPIAKMNVVAEGRILRLGRTMAFGEVYLRSVADANPAVHVASTYALLPG